MEDQLRRMVLDLLAEVKRPDLLAELVVSRVLTVAKALVVKDRDREKARQRQQRSRDKRRDDGVTLPVTNGVTDRDSVSPSPPSDPESLSLGADPERAIHMGPPVLVFPCDGKPREFAVTDELIAQHKAAFPSLDVLAQYRVALAWVQAKPERRKTAKGMPAFLLGWCGRSQDRGNGAHGSVTNGVTSTVTRQSTLPKL